MSDKLAEAIERVREGMAPKAERDAVCDAAQRTQRYDEKVQLRVLELMRERDEARATLAGIERLLLRAGLTLHAGNFSGRIFVCEVDTGGLHMSIGEGRSLAAAVQAAIEELDR